MMDRDDIGDRALFAGQISQLIPDDRDIGWIPVLGGAILDVPADQRDGVIGHVLPLVTDRMSGADIARGIRLFARLVPAQRAHRRNRILARQAQRRAARQAQAPNAQHIR